LATRLVILEKILINIVKITFVVPALNLTGGIRVISIYASYLADQGHEVTIVSPNKRIHSLGKRLKSFLTGNGWDAGSHFSMSFFTNPKVKIRVLDTCRNVTEDDVPSADFVIATFWNTAEWVKDFPVSKGKKIYFIQHYEIHSWLPVDRVKATLKFPFKKIVVSEWLKKVLLDEYHDIDVTVIPNGVDLKQFYSEKRGKQINPTVGFFYSERTFKGCDVIVEAINLARQINPDFNVVAMGMKKPIKQIKLPEKTKYFLNPSQDEIRTLYSQCDVWLFASKSEGFGLTILESMACRTPVIATEAGAAPELMKESGGRLVAVDDVHALAKGIRDILLMSNQEWGYLSDQAYHTALNHGWDNSQKLFEETLLKEQ
jgi:glycosyltransferase involved in cell wall biosynthesis